MRRFPAIASAWLAALLAAGCAATRAPSAEKPARTPMDRVLARMVFKGELEKAFHAADSLSASTDPVDREIGAYWKAVTWLYCGEPDSALVVLEAGKGKWMGGLRRVHSTLFLSLAREASQARAATRQRREEAARQAPDKAVQERIDALQKETADLRADNARLESETARYQKLLKDLENIR